MGDRRPSRVFGEAMRAARQRRGWTQKALADALAELGRPIGQTTLAKLEGGRRDTVSLDDAVAVCVALGVAPVTLLGGYEPDRPVQVTPRVELLPWQYRDWMCGRLPLTGADERFYLSEQVATQTTRALADGLEVRLSDQTPQERLAELDKPLPDRLRGMGFDIRHTPPAEGEGGERR